ncbi:MAG TPA: copper-binding protein [Thermoanaerobaculia bacterium]|nr:copper-binding protein [Thermoanaerobaculia bacterium]
MIRTWLAAAALAAAMTAACSPAEEPAADAAGEQTTAEAPSATARTYEVRGVVVRVPDPAEPLSDLVIRHDEIPDFVSMEGDVVGMKSMAMPFPVAPHVSLAEVAPGDAVSFTLEVDWEAEPAYRITRIEELPADAAPPAG